MNQDPEKVEQQHIVTLLIGDIFISEKKVRCIPIDISDNVPSDEILCDAKLFNQKSSIFDLQRLPRTKDGVKAIISYSTAPTVGCQHTACGCEIFCEACTKFFGCKKCHDGDHEMTKPTKMRCRYCNSEQPLSQSCLSCRCKMAQYFCQKCGVFDDIGDARPIKHTDRCVCSSPIPEEMCCVCQGPLSEFRYTALACSHRMHVQCLQQLQGQGASKCPICKANIANNDGELKRFVAALADKRDIIELEDAVTQKIKIPEEVGRWTESKRKVVFQRVLAILEQGKQVNWQKFV